MRPLGIGLQLIQEFALAEVEHQGWQQRGRVWIDFRVELRGVNKAFVDQVDLKANILL